MHFHITYKLTPLLLRHGLRMPLSLTKVFHAPQNALIRGNQLGALTCHVLILNGEAILLVLSRSNNNAAASARVLLAVVETGAVSEDERPVVADVVGLATAARVYAAQREVFPAPVACSDYFFQLVLLDEWAQQPFAPDDS